MTDPAKQYGSVIAELRRMVEKLRERIADLRAKVDATINDTQSSSDESAKSDSLKDGSDQAGFDGAPPSKERPRKPATDS